MKRITKRMGTAALAALMLAGSAQAATITPSVTTVELAEGENTFTVDVSISEETAFAGMEFGVDVPEGVELTEVEFLDEAIQSASHSPEVNRNGREFFGFYQLENAFSGDYEVARLTFTYSGEADVELDFAYSKIVTLNEDGTTNGDTSSNTFTVLVTREDNGGGTTDPGGETDPGDSDDNDDTGNGNNQGGGETDIGEGETPLAPLPFTDVAADAWYADAVRYVLENDIMDGTSSTTFAPNMPLTRSMMAQILYNLEGRPSVSGESSFTDVASGTWYANAVAWAAGEEIVSGYGDGTFGPEDSITREQIASILYRYAQYKGYDVTQSGDLNTFTDGGQTSGWAETSMAWAVGSGLISGKGAGVLDPLGTATRAEVAQILMAFCTQYQA